MQEFHRNHVGISQESVHFYRKNAGNWNPPLVDLIVRLMLKGENIRQ